MRGRVIKGCVLLLAAVAGCDGTSLPRSFEHEITLAASIDDRQTPVEVRQGFSLEDERIYVHLAVRNNRGPPNRDYHVDFLDGNGNIVGALGRRIVPTTADWRVAPGYRVKPGIDAPGLWAADVYVDGRHLERVRFPVVEHAGQLPATRAVDAAAGECCPAVRRSTTAQIFLGTGADDEHGLIGRRERFRRSDQKMYVYVRFNNIEAGEHAIRYEVFDAAGASLSKFARSFNVEHRTWMEWMYRDFTPADIPGEWSVDVYLDDSLLGTVGVNVEGDAGPDAGRATGAPRDPPSIVREPPRRLDGAAPDPSLAAPIARLALDAAALHETTRIPLGAVIPAGSPLVAFEIADRAVRMAVVERAIDATFDAVHYRLVAPDSGDHARLTVARSGPEVVGTVILDGSEYRMLPVDEGYQLVHPVVLHRGEYRRVRVPDLAARAGRLEARHLQMAWSAERRPGRFYTHADGRLRDFATGANGAPALGRIDFWPAVVLDEHGVPAADPVALARSVGAFLGSIPHLTWVDAPVDVEIEHASLASLYDGLGDRGAIRFRQLIGGVPVAGERQTIEIDRAGNVRALRLALVRPPESAIGNRAALIDAEQARANALAALRERLLVDWPLQLRESTLVYETRDAGAGLVWQLRFGADGCGLAHAVAVRADTGAVFSLRAERDVGTAFVPSTLRDRLRVSEAEARQLASSCRAMPGVNAPRP